MTIKTSDVNNDNNQPANEFFEALYNLTKDITNISKDKIFKAIEICTATSLIVEDELELLYNALESVTDKKKNTPYDLYIELCDNMNYPLVMLCEKHHILPRHKDGPTTPANLIKLSIPHHALAHWILWRQTDGENKKHKDYAAYILKISVDPKKLRGALGLVQKKFKEEKRQFYDPVFQSEQGKKGGLIGGAANTEKQFLARQKVGKEYGRIGGMAYKTEGLANFLEKYSIWHLIGYIEETDVKGEKKRFFKTYGNRKLDDRQVHFFFVIEPKEAFTDVAESIKLLSPLSEATNYYKLIDVIPRDGKPYRKTRSGFRLHDTLTRSETLEGDITKINEVIAGIKQEYPKATILDESDIEFENFD